MVVAQEHHHSAGDLSGGLKSSTMVVDLYCFVVLALFGGHASAYFADWSSLAEGEQPTCVAIPANMSLCNNIRKFISVKD